MKIANVDIMGPVSQGVILIAAIVLAQLIKTFVYHSLDPYWIPSWIPGSSGASVLIGWYAAHLWWHGEHKRRRQEAYAQWRDAAAIAATRRN